MKRFLRSPREIAWRLRQEAVNLLLLAQPSRLPNKVSAEPPLALLPCGEQVAGVVRNTPWADQVIHWAEAACRHHFPLLGLEIDTGPEIAWRRDYLSGKETGLEYFRRIPYLDAGRAGDHKVIWELNRHQHLVLLGQAWLLRPDPRYLNEITSQLRSWFRQNPFQRGINWASALEVAFRALSWCWIWHLVGSQLDADLRREWLQRLFLHGVHLENNLSYYFSPNTHLLGEAVALHALGKLFPEFPAAARWVETGAEVVRQQARAQVHSDGSHFEQSTYYHVYALDMFLFHAILSGRPDELPLEKIADFLQALMGPSRRLPFLGDDDGGRFFHPYGARELFGRATLATCSVLFDRPEWLASLEDLLPQAVWWLGPRVLEAKPGKAAYSSRLFPDAGIAVMVLRDVQVLIDAGVFGPWASGHSHSDALSVVLRCGDEDVLIDPGTYTYVSDPEWRNRFRGSAAHNTVRIDGRDQAIPAGPFGWKDQASVRIRAWSTTQERDELWAECAYGGFTHTRRVRLSKKDAILVIQDDIDGPAGEHTVEQFWHLGSENARERIVTELPAALIESWASSALGEKHPAPALRVACSRTLPARLNTLVKLGENR